MNFASSRLQLLASRHHAVGAFLLLTSYFLLSTSSFAAKEALLIANAEYTHFGKLPNPIPDARKLADSLRQIGFQVALVENADREQMLDALGALATPQGLPRHRLLPLRRPRRAGEWPQLPHPRQCRHPR